MKSSASEAIVAFSGHMTDSPDRPSPRFPESQVPRVRKWIRAALERRGRTVVGVSSAARGGDLLFLEELLALGGHAFVLLPFPADDFETTSVGQGWNDRFRSVLRHARVDVHAHDRLPPTEDGRNAAYEQCNAEIVDLAHRLAAKGHDARPLFLTVFSESDARRPGGTHDALTRWKARKGEVEIIDPLKGPIAD